MMLVLRDHQKAALDWLCRAQDKTPNGGVSQGYYFRGSIMPGRQLGWRPSYVETTGYIIETFYDYGASDNDLAERAKKMGYWLLGQQNEDGSFSNPTINPNKGLIFDTGQVLFGLMRCFTETSDPAFLKSAKRAGQWLAQVQDQDGAWRRHTFGSVVHSYNVRVAWAMLILDQVSPNPEIRNATRRNLNWTLSQVQPNGMIRHSGFSERAAPFTHTIAYAIRGLLEGAILLNDDRALYSAKQAADSVAQHLKEDGFLPSRISLSGHPKGQSCCLTGNCQMAIIWFRLDKIFGDETYNDVAHRALNYVLRTQKLSTFNLDIRGGIKGSHPIWGRYAAFSYPNWAAKFLLDALKLAKETQKAKEGDTDHVS